MKSLAKALRGNFTIINLGAAGDNDYNLPQKIRRSLTVFEIDAATKSRTGNNYYQRYAITNIVAGSKGRRKLFVHRNPQNTSLLPPRPELIVQYGLENDYTLEEEKEVECTTIPEILQQHQITHCDYLKTDIEGVDFEVLKNMGESLRNVLVISSELRFQPFYQGEPYFHEVVAYLHDQGFEIIGMDAEYWRPKTPNWRRHIDGRITYCDAVFFKKSDFIRNLTAQERPLLWAKQIVLACMLGQKSHAEYILMGCQNELPAEWIPELKALATPRFGTFVMRTIMMAIRYVLRFSTRKRHSIIIKSCRDEFYLGGPSRNPG
ncbi:MAG: FkbM family methyltransferase [bacterium]